MRDDARDAVKVSESQAMEACKRLKQMNVELVKSQETARKMQNILVTEKERNKELKVMNLNLFTVTIFELSLRTRCRRRNSDEN